jgi:hypothetical protein
MSRDSFEIFLQGIGSRLKYYRKKVKGMSQTNFGLPLKKSANAVKNYEKGPKGDRNFQIPLEYLFEVSKHYEVRLEWLLFEQPPIEKKS